MNSFNGSRITPRSDAEDESQATQLLQSIMEPGDVSWNTTALRGAAHEDDSNVTGDSGQSPSRLDAMPSYDFHGLAQTQTQHLSDEENNGGSQKENIGSKKRRRGQNGDVPGRPPSNGPRAGSSVRAASGTTKAKPASAKAVSFQSPRKSNAPPATRASTQRTASRSTPSSTKRVLSPISLSPVSSPVPFGEQDPEHEFLATSKVSNTASFSESPRVALPVGNESVKEQSGNRSMQSANRFPWSPSPEGTILVASTPSNSSASHSQPSQPFPETQLFDESQVDVVSGQTDYGIGLDNDNDTDGCVSDSGPTSSYFNPKDDEEDDLPLQQPQQVLPAVPLPPGATQQSTSTQRVPEDDMDAEPVHPFDEPIPVSRTSGNTAQSTGTTRSRGLLSMVDPRKRYRYEHLAQESAHRPQVTALPHVNHFAEPMDDTMDAIQEETQPTTTTGLPTVNHFFSSGDLSMSSAHGSTQPETQSTESGLPTVNHFASLSEMTDTNLQETQPSEEIPMPPPRQLPTRRTVDEPHPSLEEPPSRQPRRQFPPRKAPPTVPHTEHPVPVAPVHKEPTPGVGVAKAKAHVKEPSPQRPTRGFPARQKPTNPPPPPPPRAHAGPSRTRRQEEDAMDVVPDSEPLHEESSPESTELAARSPGKKSTRRQDARMDEVVEESIEMDKSNGMVSPEAVAKALFPGDDDDEEDDEEEDIPLAAVVPKPPSRPTAPAAKGKGKASVVEPPATRGSAAPQAPPTTSKKKNTTATASKTRTTRTAASLPTKKTSGIGRSWEIGEVPSSLPDQDHLEAGDAKRQRLDVTGAKKGKGKAAPAQTATKPKRSKTAPSGRLRGRTVLDYAESSISPSEDELPAEGDEDGTEPAEEEYQEPEVVDQSARKRKRGAAPAKAPKGKMKVAKKATRSTSSAVSNRQVKKLRSVSSAAKIAERAGTRVFALWKQDGHFYTGTVHAHSEGSHSTYVIQFDDGTDGIVSVDNMRLLDLHVGDDVLVPSFTRGVKVTDTSGLVSGLVTVGLDTGPEDVPLQAIKIASKTISYAWKDRILSPTNIITTVKPEGTRPSATPSGNSVLGGSTTRSTRSTLFDRTALAITISSTETDREAVVANIKNHGGFIVNDWSDVIRMDGKHTHSGNRWVISRSESKWIASDHVERVFLLADYASLKPKFLIALALGIPCLSFEWLNNSVTGLKEDEWTKYILPQGYSEALGARPSQQVDYDWGNSIHQLNEIMDNRVPCKLFDGKTILCVGAEMIPTQKGKKATIADEKNHEAQNAVTRIILAMGANRVEAVSDVRYASSAISSFDYVVVKEAGHYGPHLEDGTIVHWPWVKDCLVASRLLPLPQWGSQHTESQDA
ncbi:hypothetical protein H0H81_010101 [Sphagnurus paluster]|uniref:BRCT domain-containing protein n=1 Tax=Sphagnurus paluster TaxID=117069 RepID=A0A9P7GPG0_9AGAR|nr:hypothetical protein H0H81_010101 [Sphagnurus paluster]